MNKRQTRLFAIVSTAIASLVFLALTIDTHRQVAKLTNAENMTKEVILGKDVWHRNNCINCHTLFGEGAYYAPDLTKITQHRGAAYLTAYMKDPSKFYDEQKHRRLMPKQNLNDQDISHLISFLDWVSKIDNQGWPPRPIIVSGSAIPGAALSIDQQTKPAGAGQQTPPGARPVTAADNPIAIGESLFRSTPPACFACHSVSPGVNLAGPSLAGIATRTEKTIASPDYKGSAKDLAGYIRESIVNPSAHLVPGPTYSANGQSFMPTTYAKDLKPEQIEQLVAYLATLK
ncbi:c-type cytochrome [Janthinobacterium sp. 17J80-10]|uniref:c-type cytochrome n=1 Tax=Janthinobacterium sp. 17J80-10 TaxID=2497863 RepID=UPI001005972F|nr:c-type cytochrome [Janthinobacterium sp. 17J80-10]QAU35206.1 c-type cytochrome [Janthinobacterium sp. 17J80-10]